MSGPLEETMALLRAAKARHKRVVVSFSGGKDALVALDLATRTWPGEVHAFFFGTLPGLRSEARLMEPLAAHGIQPLWFASNDEHSAMAQGVYCDPHPSLPPAPSTVEYYELAMAMTGATLVITGKKRADSMARRMALAVCRSEWILHPIVGWKDREVRNYLTIRGIRVPDLGDGGTNLGVLSTQCLLRWADYWPDDFERILRVFPYARAVVERRKMYGEEADSPSARRRVARARGRAA